jgi:hypothetical protein
VFRPIDKGDNIREGRLTARSVARIIKERFEAAGFDPEEFTPVTASAPASSRAAVLAGADVFAIAEQGLEAPRNGAGLRQEPSSSRTTPAIASSKTSHDNAGRL